MKFSCVWLCMASILIAAAGCGSGGGSGSGGSGGSGGGSGGSGGSAGSGGGGTDCPQEALALLAQPVPEIGFSTPPAGPGTAAISKVSPTELEMTLGAGGQPFFFRWRGPDLSAHFTVGETVAVAVSGQWSTVTNAKATAATARGFQFVAEPFEAVPGGGPVIAFSPQCGYTKVGFCSKMPKVVSALQADVSLGAEMASAAVGQSVTLGGWEVTNAYAVQYPADSGDGGCMVEAAFNAVATALGPGMP